MKIANIKIIEGVILMKLTQDLLNKLDAKTEYFSNTEMRQQFLEDSERFNKFHISLNDFTFDYSKNNIDSELMGYLFEMAKQAGLEEKKQAMFLGEKINTTENRAVLHTALRNQDSKPIYVDGVNVKEQIQQVNEKMSVFAQNVRNGTHKGYSGKQITDVVNIGIGGSDLGPVMAYEALKPWKAAHLNCHFVSNIDATHLAETLKLLNPETTLFLVASKTFTTQETLTNANSAKKWLVAALGDDAVANHFAALSTNSDAVRAFGIDVNNMFPFWDWVGGRYSLWSAIGLSLMIAIGAEEFFNMHKGAYAMDMHFLNTKAEENIPTIMALLGVWYRNFLNLPVVAVLPYDQYLHRFAAYLQQADMESNGKGTKLDGSFCDVDSGAILFGEPGTNGQHSFYQLIHQGTTPIPCDFIAFANSQNQMGDHHEKLLANFFAQTEALMCGKTEAEVVAELQAQGKSHQEIAELKNHKVFFGNRPTNSFLFKELTPYTLGMLIAMYEHKIFVQSVIWQINAFDQWGVELGKQLAAKVLPELSGDEKVSSHDSSTNGLINLYKSYRK